MGEISLTSIPLYEEYLLLLKIKQKIKTILSLVIKKFLTKKNELKIKIKYLTLISQVRPDLHLNKRDLINFPVNNSTCFN